MKLRLMTDNLGFSDFILATLVRGGKTSFFVLCSCMNFRKGLIHMRRLYKLPLKSTTLSWEKRFSDSSSLDHVSIPVIYYDWKSLALGDFLETAIRNLICTHAKHKNDLPGFTFCFFNACFPFLSTSEINVSFQNQKPELPVLKKDAWPCLNNAILMRVLVFLCSFFHLPN